METTNTGIAPPSVPAPPMARGAEAANRPSGSQQVGLLGAAVPATDVKNAGIMIVDDEPINVKVVRKHLQNAGYSNFVTTCDPRTVLPLLRNVLPDVVVLDIMMPEVSGLDILAQMQQDRCLQHIPVLILTASTDSQTKLAALELGATDFLAKPVEATELIVRLRNMLVVKAHHDNLATYSARLEHEVRQRTAELDASRREVIHCLASAAECRDHVTGFHIVRVGRYAAIIAGQLGFDADWIEMLDQAAQLHDVGKIGIPDAILLKPGKLLPEEYDVIKTHCELGLKIIRPNNIAPGGWGNSLRPGEGVSPIMALAAEIAYTHHEKWDGTGYPRGLSGEQIPIAGRITAVADVFDALSTARPYKRAFALDECFDIVAEGRGAHFDPTVVDAFFARTDDVVRTLTEFAD